MSTDPVEIEFTPTPEDVVEARVRAARGLDSPQMRRLARRKALIGVLVGTPVGALAAFGAFSLFALLAQGQSPRPAFLIAIAVILVLWAIQVLRAMTMDPFKGSAARRFERIIRQTTDTSSLTPNRFRFDEEGVTHENDGIVTFFPWTSIESVTRADDAWYLRASNEVTLRVPDRVVPDGRALAELIERNSESRP